nr:MAG: capsid protein [Cressdnaviricota sp.]
MPLNKYARKSTRPVRRITRIRRTTVRRPARRMRMLRTPRTNNQFAQISETASYPDLLSNAGPIATTYVDSNSGFFPRSQAMARLFQQSRIVQVIYTYEPLYNVFQGTATVGSGTSVPDLYMLMDRQGAFSGTVSAAQATLSNLIAGGARPRKFTKNIVIKYKPNTFGVASVTPGLYDSTTTATPGYLVTDVQYDKWFQTDCLNVTSMIPQPIRYYGHVVIISQENTIANSAPVARTNVTIVTQYKMPYYPSS